MSSYLKRKRAQIDQDLGGSPDRRFFSPVLYGQFEVTLRLIKHHARGRLLDIGCGVMPYRPLIEPLVDSYEGFDIEARTDNVNYLGDIQDMRSVPSDTFDTAICLEVLEHVPDPFRAAAEIRRVLKPGGVLIASTPHLSRLHEEPHDYYRYTHYGLRHLFTQAGLTVETIQHRGSLASFLGHQLSNGLLSATWGIPVLGRLAWLANKWMVTRLSYALDAVLDRRGTFALGYTVVARKPRADDAADGPVSTHP
jgi:SAM-dependent methyltransferase